MTHPVDPAEAQRFVHRLRPGDAGLAGVALAETHVQDSVFCVMALEPGAKGPRRLEEHDSHPANVAPRSCTCPSVRSSASSSRSRRSKELAYGCAVPSASALPPNISSF